MEKVDLFALYAAGANLRPIVSLGSEATTVPKVFGPLVNALDAIGSLLSNSSPVKLGVSRAAALELNTKLKEIEKRYFKDEEGQFHFPPPDTEVEWWSMSQVQNAISTFEAVFRAEIQNSATYRVPEKGTFNTGDLVDRARETFSKEVKGLIGNVACGEYDSAGRCYAFGLYSAAGYHSCRAVEAVLRIYYKFFTNSEPGEKDNWGNFLSALEDVCEEPKPDPKTLGHIRHIKDYNRNPLSHLRAVLDEDDADILLSEAKVVITVMALEVLRVSKAEAETSVASETTQDLTV